jgi:transposase
VASCSIAASPSPRALPARRVTLEILTDLKNELPAMAREALSELYDLFRDLDRRIASFDKRIERIFRESEEFAHSMSIAAGRHKKVASGIVLI